MGERITGIKGSKRKLSERRLFGRRKSHKLSPRQAQLIAELLPRLEIELDSEDQLGVPDIFAEPYQRYWLEIGFGGGEHLVWQALNNPDTGIIGCEPFVNGVAKLLAAVKDNDLTNVRVYCDDARRLLDRLPDQSISQVFLLFPDPWPKARHAKRRFVSQEQLETLYTIMAPGSELRVASDIPDYTFWTLSQVAAHRGFAWLAETARDWRVRPDDWPETRYERKARDEGRRPTYLRFRRRRKKTAGWALPDRLVSV